jgi:DNA end-binding protein Ku
MRFANELVDISDYSFPGTAMLREQELTMAKQLVENLAEPFDPARYTTTTASNLMKLIRAKMKGKKVTAAEPLPDDDETRRCSTSCPGCRRASRRRRRG